MLTSSNDPSVMSWNRVFRDAKDASLKVKPGRQPLSDEFYISAFKVSTAAALRGRSGPDAVADWAERVNGKRPGASTVFRWLAEARRICDTPGAG